MTSGAIWAEVKPKLWFFLFLFLAALSFATNQVMEMAANAEFAGKLNEIGAGQVETAKVLVAVLYALMHSITLAPILFIFSYDRESLAALAALPIGPFSLALHRYRVPLVIIGIPLFILLVLASVASALLGSFAPFLGAPAVFASIAYALAVIAFFQLVLGFLAKSPTGLAQGKRMIIIMASKLYKGSHCPIPPCDVFLSRSS